VKQTVLLAALVAILNQTSPALGQEAQLRESLFSSASDKSRDAVDVSNRPNRSDRVATRSAQMMPVPQVHRNVSLRRLALGALIGGAAGAALGYGLASSSCGTSSSPQECAGYGRLGAVMAGGVGVALGVHIAAGRP
jgi:hypothetical protein